MKRVSEIENLLNKVTEGNWSVDRTDQDGWVDVVSDVSYVICQTGNQNYDELNEHDTVFIAQSKENVNFLISTIKRLHAENERYREAFEVVKSDYITYETERAKLERKYAFESKEKSIDKYARIRDTGAVEALSNILFALDVDEYKLQQKARQALEQSHD